MTRYAPLWQQAGSYPAQLDRSLLGALWPAGGALGRRGDRGGEHDDREPAARLPSPCRCRPGQGSRALPLGRRRGRHPRRRPALAGRRRIDLIVAQVRDNGDRRRAE